MLLALLACSPDPDTAAPVVVEGAPTNWWTFSWECLEEPDALVTVPALPTTDPLVLSCAHVYEDAVGTVTVESDCPDLKPEGGSLNLCDEGDISGRITLGW